MAVEDAYELAYREAVRALDHQLAALTELRSRAGLLLAAASVTVSLPGPHVLVGDRPFAWLAVVCFASLSLCALTIVWPRGDWHFITNPHDLLAEQLGHEQLSVTTLALELIAHMAADQRANGLRLMRIARVFHIGAGLLVIQILSTVAAASGAA